MPGPAEKVSTEEKQSLLLRECPAQGGQLAQANDANDDVSHMSNPEPLERRPTKGLGGTVLEGPVHSGVCAGAAAAGTGPEPGGVCCHEAWRIAVLLLLGRPQQEEGVLSCYTLWGGASWRATCCHAQARAAWVREGQGFETVTMWSLRLLQSLPASLTAPYLEVKPRSLALPEKPVWMSPQAWNL